MEKLLSDINKRKPSLSVITGDYNARSSNWWCKDINTTEKANLYSLTSSNGSSQLINETTHIQVNSLSCIDLILTDQPNLSMNSEVHSSLHPNSHHHIVHSRFNLNIYYPPQYQRLTWDYKKTHSKMTRKALDMVNWEKLFDKKDLNAQVIALNETILNIFRNYVPNKYIIVDDKDPEWMSETIKSKMKAKTRLYKRYIKNRSFESDFVFIESLVNEINDLVSNAKNLYYNKLAKRLKNPLLPAKTYWSILKTIYNDKNVLLIPPLLIDDKFVTDIQAIANIFNNFLLTNVHP